MKTKHDGFTIIELLVVTVITAVLTSMVTFNFRQARSTQEVNASAQEFISKIREIQSFVQNGKIVPGRSKPADAYEITLTSGAATYRIDSDVDNVVNTLETVALTANMRISQVYINNVSVTGTTLRITAPYAKVLAGGSANKTIKIELSQTVTGDKKTVIIDGISGRMGLE